MATPLVKCPHCGYRTSAGSLAAHVSMAHKAEKPAVAPLAPAKPAKSRKAAIPAVLPATREAWMLAAVAALTPDFEAAGATVPAVRVSVGWPGGRGNKQHVVGQCWMSEAVADGQPAIFVSPVQQDPGDVLETLAHELVHACGNRGHRGGFAKLAGKLGFMAPFASTPASLPLKARLHALAGELGPFPHARITSGTLAGLAGPPVQGTRMLKVECPGCGCVLRMTKTWIENAGLPTCGCGTEMVRA